MGSLISSFKKKLIHAQKAFYMKNHEKLEMFKEALLFHSMAQEMTSAELKWCEWAKERIEQLMAEK